MVRVAFLCLALAVSVNVRQACAASVPLDENGFTAYMAEAFRKADPEVSVTVIAPLRLEVKKGANTWPSYLYNIHSYCVRVPETCEHTAALHARQMAASHNEQSLPIEASALRMIVRPKAYVEQLARSFAGRGDPIAEPIAGDL
jgi:hypothetical protein